MLQTFRVWATRAYYRRANARAWRGQFTDAPFSTLQLPGPGGQLQTRVYSSKQGRDKPLIIYFHGGGWVIGDLATHHPFCQAGHVESIGPTNGNFVLAGDSAGGHLAACTALAVDAALRSRLAGALLIYPVVDHYSHPYPSYTERARGQTLTSAVMRWFWDTWLEGRGADAAGAAGAVIAAPT